MRVVRAVLASSLVAAVVGGCAQSRPRDDAAGRSRDASASGSSVEVSWSASALPADTATIYALVRGRFRCADVYARLADPSSIAPEGVILAVEESAPWTSGRARLRLPPAQYVLLLEASAPLDPSADLAEIVGRGCAEIQVRGSGSVTLEVYGF